MNEAWRQFSVLALEYYDGLPKTGKPQDNEWTSLAALFELGDVTRVVSLATGTKCVSGKPAKADNVIIDCHAESLCRRAFKRYLIGKLKFGKALDDHEYFMIISQLPCGILDRYKGSSETDCLLKKPGRGDRCPKPSCAFKISKWLKYGIQGEKFKRITGKQIDLCGLIIGNCTESVETTNDVLLRMDQIIKDCQLLSKSNEPLSKKLKIDHQTVPIHFDRSFKVDKFTKCDSKRASFTSIVSWLGEDDQKVTEIVVQGKRQGATGKSSKNTQLLVSSMSINSDIETLRSKDVSV